MNAEHVLKYAMAIKEGLPESEKELVEKYVNEGFDHIPLASLILAAKKEIMETNARQNGRKEVLAFARFILKQAERSNYPQLRGAINDVDDHQYFCDGYMLLRLSEKLDLPPVPDNQPKVNASGMTNWDMSKYTPIEKIPTAGELKAYIAECKVTGKNQTPYGITWGIENGPRVNAEWLMKALRAFPNAKLYQRAYCGGGTIYVFDHEKDEGCMILGIRRVQ